MKILRQFNEAASCCLRLLEDGGALRIGGEFLGSERGICCNVRPACAYVVDVIWSMFVVRMQDGAAVALLPPTLATQPTPDPPSGVTLH